MWDLSSLTSAWTCIHCIARPVVNPLEHQGSPDCIVSEDHFLITVSLYHCITVSLYHCIRITDPVSDHFQITSFCSELFCLFCIRYTILEFMGFKFWTRFLDFGFIYMLSLCINWKVKVKVKLLHCVQLFATPWTLAYQAPPSMGFSR